METGRKKAGLSAVNQVVLGFVAGAFVAFASAGTNSAIHTIGSVGLSKALAGALFSTALMLILIAGGELFTGNCLMVIAWAEGKISLLSMFRNWILVYAGNFIGSVFLAYLISQSGQLEFSGGLLGGFTLRQAAYKVELPFLGAFLMGLLCNWLVCAAVWTAAAARDIAGKVLAIFFPIWLFVSSGFEHCVANMYYIPAGILAKETPLFTERAAAMGAAPESIASLSWGSFLTSLLPVTLGNVVGGGFFVGFIYWFVYLTRRK